MTSDIIKEAKDRGFTISYIGCISSLRYSCSLIIDPDLRVFDPQNTVDLDKQPVQCSPHRLGIIGVRGPWLVPDHLLAELGDEVFDPGASELVGEDRSVRWSAAPRKACSGLRAKCLLSATIGITNPLPNLLSMRRGSPPSEKKGMVPLALLKLSP